MGILGKHKVLQRALVGVASVGLVAAGLAITSASAQATPTQVGTTITSAHLGDGQIKHVWLIILENKSYDATFTGLNQNSYLWKTLPSQGVLLTNYYGTGHSSQDNYISLVSGQGPEEDTQSDCSVADTNFGSNDSIVKSGINAGQVASTANAAQPSGANAPNGANGCTYPTDTPTLFNQLDAAGKTWKGYAQDLGNQAGREDATCGGPGSAANNPTTNPTYLSATVAHPLPAGVTSFTGAQANDQYVAKHFPFPWFESLTGTVTTTGTTPALTTPAQGGTDCDAAHIANLDSASGGLFHDLQKESTTPAFSWITPDNCSDAHDAICKGNNLSGSFTASGAPIYQPGTPNPESTTPKNYTGGLYASDLFLEYYIPMIEKSAAFKDGGLIDVTFDEGNPPFTYSGNSFNNANAYGPTLADQPNATAGITADAAGETLFGKTVHTEPTGVNSTLGTNSAGDQLYPGPGNNSFIDRPPSCATSSAADCVTGIVEGGSGSSPGPRTDTSGVSGGSGSSIVNEATSSGNPSLIGDDTGREINSITIGGTPVTYGSTAYNTDFPNGLFVGTVSDTGELYPTNSGGATVTASFQAVDDAGNPVTITGPVTAITLSGEGDPALIASESTATAPVTADPLFDATDPTPGGGDTGSVLISPFITPGSVSTTSYNHYSWLRTMEDLFDVSSCSGTSTDVTLPAGTVCGGLDGQGHIGYAAQTGLEPFGADVFTSPSGNGFLPPIPANPGEGTPEAPLAVGLPALGILVMLGYLVVRRRRNGATA